MDYIIDYLSEPTKIGVYTGLFKLDFSKLEKLFRHLAKTVHKSERFARMAEEISWYDDRTHYLGAEDIFDEAIIALVDAGQCPKVILEYIIGRKIEEKEESVSRVIASRKLRFEKQKTKASVTLISRSLFDIPDALAVQRLYKPREKSMYLDAATVKEEGLSRFRNFLKNIPFIGESCEEIQSSHTNLPEYALRTYPFAVALLIYSEKGEKEIPKNLIDFLRGAVMYHNKTEWRISIVLSAITVEMILADLYKHIYKGPVPKIALGQLYGLIYPKIKTNNFSDDIDKGITKVRKTRNVAVHRSKELLSIKEATDVLFGATAFTIWFSNNYYTTMIKKR